MSDDILIVPLTDFRDALTAALTSVMIEPNGARVILEPDSPLPTAIATEEQYVAVEGALNDYRATPAACSVCLGSGQVADDGEITPWPIWTATGPHPDQGVEAISCPKCEGTGEFSQD